MMFSVDGLAAALIGARRTGARLPTASPPPGSVRDAYAVQDRVVAAIGTVGAWKVGAATPDGEVFGGPIFTSDVHVGTGPVSLPGGRFSRRGMEVEIVVRLGRDLGPGATIADARAAIATLHAAIEIVDTRYDGWPLPEPLLGLADNQNNGALVYEPAGVPFAGQDIGQGDIRLTVDGVERAAGIGRNTGGDPARSIAWLASHLAERGGLKAGAVVTTGSLNTPDFVGPAARIEARIAGIGALALAFTA